MGLKDDGWQWAGENGRCGEAKGRGKSDAASCIPVPGGGLSFKGKVFGSRRSLGAVIFGDRGSRRVGVVRRSRSSGVKVVRRSVA